MITFLFAAALTSVAPLSDIEIGQKLSALLGQPTVIVVDPNRQTVIPPPDSDKAEAYKKFLRRKFRVIGVGGIAVLDLDWSNHMVLTNYRAQYIQSMAKFTDGEEPVAWTLPLLTKRCKLGLKSPKYFDDLCFAIAGNDLAKASQIESSLVAVGQAIGLKLSVNKSQVEGSVDPKRFRSLLTEFALKRRTGGPEQFEPEDFDFARAVYANLTDSEIIYLAQNPTESTTKLLSPTSPLMGPGRAKFEASVRDDPKFDPESRARSREMYVRNIDFNNLVGRLRYSLTILPLMSYRGKDPTAWFNF